MLRLKINGNEIEVKEGTTLSSIYESLGIKDAIGGLINGKIFDLQTPIYESGEVKPVRKGDPESLEIMRHSLAHIMAQALKEIYGSERVHLGVGPTTEDGFYYDVEVEGVSISEEDLPKIEKKMKEIISRNYPILRKELEREEAKELFKKLKEHYKEEIIDRIPDDERISVYQQGDFIDLCKGPHLPSTGKAGVFKLTSVAGAYWMGDSSRPMLQRIYGIAFWDKKELEERIRFYEEAKRRDHRKLGRELEFFMIDEEIGPGLVVWLPRGSIFRRILEDYWKDKHIALGYQLVYTPHVGRSQLWERSGHLEYYKPNMFPEMDIEGTGYYVKPMNCPFHVAIYKSKVRSYRDLPFKLAELGTVYRYEMSGVLHGLMRVRGFTQDDAHIVCRPDQVKDVIKEVLDLTLEILRDFGFDDFEVYISTKPEYAIGSDDQWKLSEDALKTAVEEAGLTYKIDEGGGAFYGPKIDVKIRDAIGRLWQCSTVQFDFNLPERFDMYYIGDDNQKHRPYMIHRAIFGSIERFTGILLEHYAGLLPLWLSPTQAVVIPIADRHHDYALKVRDFLIREGFRVEADLSDDRMNAKIRKAELMKIPYILVVGDREVEESTVSVRSKKEGNIGAYPLEEFVRLLKEKIKNKE